VAEELALDEVGRKTARVDDDEGPLLSRAVVVERPGHELLARAGLSLHQHRRVGSRDFREEREEASHRRGGTHEGPESIRRVEGVLALALGELEEQLRPAKLEARPVPQKDLPDAIAVEVGAIGAAEVAEEEALVGSEDLHVNA